MKIEMGESLAYSYLKHIKKCQSVETNWKLSPSWDRSDLSELDSLFRDTLPLFNSIYSKNSKVSLDSFLRQGECDVLGLKLKNGKTTVIAADVAYHAGGLNYNAHTVEKVIEKSIRTAMSIYAAFNIKAGEIYFISPKVGKVNVERIMEKLAKLKAISDSHGFSFTYNLICNEDFKIEILDKVLNISNDVADSNELFLRAYQLYNLCNKLASADMYKSNSKELKIGAYAKTNIKALIEAGKLTNSELNELLDKNASKRIFDINYPVLVNVNDSYDRLRYYVENNFIIEYQNEKYVLCSQWVERCRKSLEAWVNKH